MFALFIVTICSVNTPELCEEHKYQFHRPTYVCPVAGPEFTRPGWSINTWRCEK